MSSRFVNDVASAIFVNRDPVTRAVERALNENRRLGQHTDIFVLSKQAWMRYTWNNPKSRPWGEKSSLYLQCACGVLRTQKLKKRQANEPVQWRCRICKATKDFPLPSPLLPVREGMWLIQPTEAVPNTPEWLVQRAALDCSA